jgi:hypothetical protein
MERLPYWKTHHILGKAFPWSVIEWGPTFSELHKWKIRYSHFWGIMLHEQKVEVSYTPCGPHTYLLQFVNPCYHNTDKDTTLYNHSSQR